MKNSARKSTVILQIKKAPSKLDLTTRDLRTNVVCVLVGNLYILFARWFMAGMVGKLSFCEFNNLIS